MYCCTNCFLDIEIKAIIDDEKIIGTCDFCGRKNIAVYEIENETTLADAFDGLLEVYTSIKNLPNNYPKEKTDLLKNLLYSQWCIFNVSPEKIYQLITTICHEKYDENPELFDAPVGIWQNYDSDFLQDSAIITNYSWQEFVDAIKWENRFHTNYINEEVLNLFIRCVRKTYRAGSKFFRARICSDVMGYSFRDVWEELI